ncbi:MAG: 1-deoxy-D-xylulose-5-phosphate reductoisomerase [Thermogutta sp.]|jgi:1-deoxy-D-xylulose-5-phosphate reductoisomerase|uniref:1-deoxy-D-xylulose-5-phosphate reductoisomerase n=1 Tax=Thermogutta terrifontis TaxID=1331910 RepID=UPI000BA87D35|nr:1-deoxy-D-xylulose-5-phosphate reductoisomerase [Thermogutta terrifontis]
MTDSSQGIAVLGSTGSIGRNALEVIAASEGRLRAVVLVARSNTQLLERQAHEHRPTLVVVTDPEAARRHGVWNLPPETELRVGEEAVLEAVSSPTVDRVLSAYVGIAGLRATWKAVEAGKTVALANKESLVVAGPLITQLAQQTGAQILPVDSEHSAVFQALRSGQPKEVRRIILTASGGPFRTKKKEELASVTVEEALAHPTWKMGRKITVDSATLMNKALEIIEARWLFGVTAEQIAVVIHPQSIVHSMVEFVDGSVIAQLSPPDMRLPIQYALYYPERCPGIARKIDWTQVLDLRFEPPDPERFPAIRLGLEAARRGGTAGAVLNAANEAAVECFLQGRLRFDQIVPACEAVLESHPFDPEPTLERIFELDSWARREIAHWT